MGRLKIFGPRQSPTGAKSDGGGLAKKKSDWSQNCPPNAKLGLFLLFKHRIQFFNVLLSLKVVKFDTKMYLNFSNFRGRTLAGGGGQALVQKCWQMSDVGIDNIYARWGTLSPQENPWRKREEEVMGRFQERGGIWEDRWWRKTSWLSSKPTYYPHVKM